MFLDWIIVCFPPVQKSSAQEADGVIIAFARWFVVETGFG
jgi:hypothetical protein